VLQWPEGWPVEQGDGDGKCSRKVASVAVASRMARVAMSREVASAAGRWQVQHWPVGCQWSREMASAAEGRKYSSGQ
jgi:hypothetical protein